MSSVGKESILSSPCLMRSVMKKYRILMCFLRLELEGFPFFLQEYGILVVLVHDSAVNAIVLCIQKVVGPADLRHEIIRSNKFIFSRAPSVELLIGGGGHDRTLSK